MILIVLLVSFCSFLTASYTPSLTKHKIVGGMVADVIPYQVSLEEIETGAHICGGVIITKNIVITAAHCTHMFSGKYRIRAGTSTREKGGQVIKVSHCIAHPSYESNTLDFDIAILKLKKNLKFDERVQPIDLVNADEPVEPGTNAIISGWGVEREYANKGSSKLMFAIVPVFDWNICKKDYYYQLTERMICAGDRMGKVDSCNMDSGGPMVANDKLIGIISSGMGCAVEDTLGIYVNIAYLRPWIDKVVKIITCINNNC